MTTIPDKLVDQLFDRLIKDGRTNDAFAFLNAIVKNEPLEPILARLDPKLAKVQSEVSPAVVATAKKALAGAKTPAQAVQRVEPTLAIRPPMSDEEFVKSLPSADMIKLFNTPKDRREEMLIGLRQKHGIAVSESLTEADAGQPMNDQQLRQFFKGLAQSAVAHGMTTDSNAAPGKGGKQNMDYDNNPAYVKVHATEIDMNKVKQALQKLGVSEDQHAALMAMLDTVKKSPDPKNPKFQDPKLGDLYKEFCAAVIMATTVK